MSDLLDTASRLLQMATAAGVDSAEVCARRSSEAEVTVRLGSVDRVHNALTLGYGLRVFLGGRQGFAFTSGGSPHDLGSLVARARESAVAAQPDPSAELPEPEWLAMTVPPDLEDYDPRLAVLELEDRVRMASEAEEESLAHPGTRGSEGSTFSDLTAESVLVNTRGLSYAHRATRCSIASRPVAAGGTSGRQAGLWFATARRLSRLESPRSVGRIAAERATRMLGARSVPTGRASVIFDPIEAGRFWGGIFPAFSGDVVHRGLSCLAGRLSERIASPDVTLIDDGRLPGGPGTAPRDGEGVPTRQTVVVDSGILRTFLYDCRSARRAEAVTTASAARGFSSLPAVAARNFYLAPGLHTPEEIIASTRRGLYVIHAMGFGFNTTTGDYSRGASGLWIENGELAYPVQEVVLSERLSRILPSISMVAGDHAPRSTFSSPTFKVDEMVISGR